MGELSAIEWTTHTFNPWIGCAKVSPGCKHCYAETLMDTRYGRVVWGAHGTRVRTGEAYWRKPLAWNRVAEAAGERPRVFCASLADVFEDRAELVPWRAELFDLIEVTPNLDWQLLTKRPENVLGMVPGVWRDIAFPPNVWIGTSVEDQERANERIPHLLRIPDVVRFLSMEPLLGPVDLTNVEVPGQTAGRWFIDCIRCDVHEADDAPFYGETIDWVIIGGESGPKARPFHAMWAESLLRQCRAAEVPVFLKQMGAHVRDRNDVGFDAMLDVDAETGEPTERRAWPEPMDVEHDVNGFREEHQGADVRVHLRDKKGGDWDEWPLGFRVREFPVMSDLYRVGHMSGAQGG